MGFLIKRFGLVVFGLLSIVEGVLNTLLYVTILDKLIKPFDFAFPFYFTYIDKFMKQQYLKQAKNQIDGQDLP